jgi:phosphatidylglycerophosphatase A
VTIVVFTLISIPSINRLEKVWGEDPSRVVVDEMVGVWISLLAVPSHGHWGYIVGAIGLFRLFDIVKPFGVRRMERIRGGWGVMLDDILAGVYGATVLLIMNIIFLKWA